MALFGKKSEHPMADPKAARELLAELPKNDALKALQEITGWIESLRTDPDLRLDGRYAALKLLDDTARAHENKVTREYFPPTPPSKLHENRLWTALNGFFSNLAGAYQEVLEGCMEGVKGAASLKEDHIAIAMRGIHATTGWMKCAAVRYAPPDETAWTQLAEYYLHAKELGYLDEEFEIPGNPGLNSSVRRRIAGVLLWWGTGTGSLKPQQIHLCERLTTHLSPYLDMSDEPGEDCQFSFDLETPKTPARAGKDAVAAANLRFVRLGKVQSPLEALVSTLEKNMVPSNINLGGPYETEGVLEAAKRLAASWLAAPPVRRTVRRTINVPMNVVRGYAGLIDQAHGGDTSGEPAGEDWEAEDISLTGFRCILPAGTGGWVKVGALIGYRPQNVQHWGAGIVRRLRRNEQNELDVGVEVLATHVSSVSLREQGSKDERLALWLTKNGEDGEARLLMTPGAFAENRTLQGNMGDRQVLLMPQKLDEKGEDYDLMRYRKVIQETA